MQPTITPPEIHPLGVFIPETTFEVIQDAVDKWRDMYPDGTFLETSQKAVHPGEVLAAYRHVRSLIRKAAKAYERTSGTIPEGYRFVLQLDTGELGIIGDGCAPDDSNWIG